MDQTPKRISALPRVETPAASHVFPIDNADGYKGITWEMIRSSLANELGGDLVLLGGIEGADIPATATAKGEYYVVTAAGASQGENWTVGDKAIYSGTSGDWIRIPAASEVTFKSTGATKARSLAERFAESVNVKDYEAEGDFTTDDSDALQEAIDYAYENDIHNVFLPPGVYKISRTIKLPKGIRLFGAGCGGGMAVQEYTANPSEATIRASGVTVIFLAADSNCVMFEADSTRATIERETFSSWDGRGTINQYTFNIEIADLTLHGNARSQSRHDCDLVKMVDGWGLTISRCNLVFAAGFTVNAWDCNVVKITDVIIHGDLQKTRGVLFYDTADSIIDGASMAGGFVSPAIWVATPSGWLNNFSSLHFGDTQNIETGAEILSVADNVMTVSQNARIETGQPVIFWTHSFDADGALPTGIVAGQVYFAIKIDATHYAFNASLPAALAGTKAAIGDTGTKCWLKIGPSVCCYLSQAAKNVFSTIRWDNGRDACVVLEGATNNIFSSCQITKPGGGVDRDRVGLWIRSGSGNLFSDLVFADARNPLRMDAGTNYFGHYSTTNCTNPPSFSSGARSFVEKSAAGGVSFSSLVILSPDSTLPLNVTVTDSPIVARFQRAGSVVANMVFRLTETGDGVGRDALYIGDGVSGEPLMGWAGNATLAEAILGPDLLAAPRTLRFRGGYATGTNVAGNDVEIVPGGGTGNAAPGKLLLKVPVRNASGVSQQTTHATGLSVEETKVDASKPFLPPRMTKAARNALTAENGMTIYQTDNTPGVRVYENGAWVAYTATADP